LIGDWSDLDGFRGGGADVREFYGLVWTLIDRDGRGCVGWLVFDGQIVGRSEENAPQTFNFPQRKNAPHTFNSPLQIMENSIWC